MTTVLMAAKRSESVLAAGLPLTPIRLTRLSERIYAQIRNMIAARALRPGDRLPAERDLARQMNVARSTLREALRTLETVGFVKSKAGSGVFLRLPSPLDLHAPIAACQDEWPTRVAYEADLILESRLAELAAMRATPDDLARLHRLLEAQAAHISRGESDAADNFAFHMCLAEIPGNPPLYAVVCRLRRLLQERGMLASLLRDPRRSLSNHRAILQAVEAHKPRPSREHMRQHLLTGWAPLFDAPSLDISLPIGELL